MKNFRFLIPMILLSHLVVGQYSTPGTGVNWDLADIVSNASGVMTFEGTKYLLWSNLTISQNDTLHVLTDELLQINAGVEINVLGTFLSNPPVLFHISAMDTTAHFKGLYFDNSDGSVIEKCKIEYGGGIKLIDADVTFDSCIIGKHNQANCTGTIDMINSSPVIRNSMIYDNMGPAVLSAANGNSSPQIIDNQLLQNCTSNLNMPQINLGTSSPADSIRIIGNTISGLYDNSGGIAVATLAGGTIRAIIQENLIENNRYGITAYGMNIYTLIFGNQILNNNIQGDPMLGGSGINFWGDQTNQSMISGNEISGNLWGITVQNQALPNLGQVDPDTINEGKNLIYDNGNNGTIYALYNNTPNNLFAENNYWGTFDPEEAESYIFHQPDDPALGFVDYLPIKDYITSIPDQNNDVQTTLEFYPNPAERFIYIESCARESQLKNSELKVINLSGREVLSVELFEGKQAVDVSMLPAGIYLLWLSTEDHHSGQILIKE